MNVFEKKQAKLNAQIAAARVLDENKENVINALKTAYKAVNAVDGDKTMNAYKKELLNSFVTAYKYLVGVKTVSTEEAINVLSGGVA